LNGIKDIEGAKASFPCRFGYAASSSAGTETIGMAT